MPMQDLQWPHYLIRKSWSLFGDEKAVQYDFWLKAGSIKMIALLGFPSAQWPDLSSFIFRPKQ
ncbi:hypothetical protein SXCC_00035 [Gluconacetobacter sp. SXCC-1]|nr:hypothetical protein SXCC_00035 [Gluconacetobacter sp. SXCC-1]